MSFKIGDRVEWASQAGSYEKIKSGWVAEIVPAATGCYAVRDRVAALTKAHNCGKAAFGYGGARKHDSYLIIVDFPGTKKKPRVYWPVASKLKAASAINA